MANGTMSGRQLFSDPVSYWLPLN